MSDVGSLMAGLRGPRIAAFPLTASKFVIYVRKKIPRVKAETIQTSPVAGGSLQGQNPGHAEAAKPEDRFSPHGPKQS